MPHRIDRARFFSKLKLNTLTGCMEWPGETKNGYGIMYSTAGKFRTHRVAAYLAGLIDNPRGVVSGLSDTNVLHRCDNPICCNPAHLFVGDHAANVADAVTKGRMKGFAPLVGPHRPTVPYEKLKTGMRRSQLRGDLHHRKKLTEAQVADIRLFWDAGIYSQGEMAKMYGVTQGLLSLICNRKHRKLSTT